MQQRRWSPALVKRRSLAEPTRPAQLPAAPAHARPAPPRPPLLHRIMRELDEQDRRDQQARAASRKTPRSAVATMPSGAERTSPLVRREGRVGGAVHGQALGAGCAAAWMDRTAGLADLPCKELLPVAAAAGGGQYLNITAPACRLPGCQPAS